MAIGKKKETLTPEERLQAALVPESEQLYPVPGNWCWIRLGASINLYNGDRGTNYPSKKDYQSSGIPFVNAGAIVDGELNEEEFNYISEDKYDSLRAGKIQQGDILYCLRGSLGKTAIVHQKFKGAISSSLCILRANESLLKEYLYYLLCSNVIGHQQILAENGSAQPNLSAASVMDYMIPFSPLAEQQRIVDRIESLFAKLDEAKQKAKDTLDSFETRKAAILHKAFTGELTARWRKEHGVGMESWKEETLGSVCYSIFDGDHMPPPKSEKGIPFLVISNVNTGYLSFENTRFVPESYYEALSDTRKPGYGDVLYTLVGSYGIPVIVDSEYPFCFQRHMALLKPKNIDSYYLWYILQSREMFEKATQIATGTAQLTVPIKGLRKLKFNCASANEQTEIVRILHDLLAKEQQAKEAAEGVLEQIDLIKKAILARAFRGELGTNDPSEESAVELLKQISSY